MNTEIFRMTDEQSSPLFRIMSAWNLTNPQHKAFDNNISASHIGNGYILSVAHNLILEAGVVRSIDEPRFQADIIANANANDVQLFNRCYLLDATTNMRHLNCANNSDIPLLTEAFQRIGFDTRWTSLYSNTLSTPALIIQFKSNQYYSDPVLTALFHPTHAFHEPQINAFTFVLELDLISTFDSADFALYRIKHQVDRGIVARLPFAPIVGGISELGESLYCLQGSPSGTNLGRMVNESRIEGILDHHSVQNQRLGNPIFFEGLRYLLKGYFRFGSSGAPYLRLDANSEELQINAIQSEASGIQLQINNSRDGHFQYVNAIASPIELIAEELENLMDDNIDGYAQN